MDGVDGPPTTELAKAPGAAVAIAGLALGAAAAIAAVPLIIVDIPAPAIAGTPDAMEVAGFIPLVLSSIFAETGPGGSIADTR